MVFRPSRIEIRSGLESLVCFEYIRQKCVLIKNVICRSLVILELLIGNVYFNFFFPVMDNIFIVQLKLE